MGNNTEMTCGNCGQSGKLIRQRCHNCYCYRHKYGVERPQRLISPKSRPKWCYNCKSTKAPFIQGMCKACHGYKKRTGRTRPRYRWDKELGCATCGVPLSTVERHADKCAACYAYKLRYGRERPRRLWGIGPAGWCECGFPAVAVVEKNPVCNRHRG